MAVFHYKNDYCEQYSVSDSDIVHFLGNYAGFAEPQLMKIAEKELTEEKLQNGFDVLYKDIRRVLYEDFKNIKSLHSYDDYVLARTIMFPNPKDIDNYYKNSMIVIVKLLNELKKEISQFKGDYLCRECFASEAAFLHQILFQIIEFTNIVATDREGKNYSGLYSRKHRLSQEVYSLAREITRGRTFTNDITHFSEAIFLIRQTIELRVLELLNLDTVWNKKYNREVKVAPDIFIDILDDPAVKFLVECPNNKTYIDIKFIKDVHKWTNMFVHTGHTYWLWEVEFVRGIIVDFVLSQVRIDDEYMKSVPERILRCIKEEERVDTVVIMTEQFYKLTGISYPLI